MHGESDSIMGKVKPQTRVIARVIDADRQLLSVREASKGTLILSPSKAERNFEHDPSDFQNTSSQKYSIHPDEHQRGANSVHHVLMSETGDKIETYSRTTAVQDGGVWPLYTRAIFESALEIITELSPRDRHITVADYRPSHSMLMISVFIGPPKSGIKLFTPSGIFNVYPIDFRLFTLYVLTSYVIVNTLPHGWIRHEGTANLVRNDVGRGSEVLIPSAGLSPTDATKAAEFLFHDMHLKVHTDIPKLIDLDGASDFLLAPLIRSLREGPINRPYIPGNYPFR